MNAGSRVTNRDDISHHSPYLVSTHEEMNPSRRCSMEDCSVYHPPGTWESPDGDIAYLGVYDGHGGRDMVEYLEHGLSYHVARELQCHDDSTVLARLERAFMIADIHSNQLGVTMSGATVAVCLVVSSVIGEK
jgi:protein phosphatase